MVLPIPTSGMPRRREVAALTLALVAGVASRAVALVAVGPGLSAVIDESAGVALLAEARAGDGWWSLSERLCGDGRRHRLLSAENGGTSPVAGRRYRVPPELWPAGSGARALHALFPEDRATPEGWRHVVRAGRALGRAESPWTLARLFAGDGRRHADLALPAGAAGRGLRPGDVVLVPWDLMAPHLRPAGGFPPAADDDHVASPPAADDDHVASPPAADDDVLDGTDAGEGDCPVPVATVDWHPAKGARSDDGALAFAEDEQGAHAIYRLQAGETLYSAVVLRFTDLLSGRCVNEAALRHARRSGIRDVTDIPVGWPVRIPVDELRADLLPRDHPRRLAWEAERRLADELADVEQRRHLEGVHVLLDSGHGGIDPGARAATVWEDDYAYDIACRIKAALEDRTHATVHPLVQDRSTGWAPLSQITADSDEILLTSPALALDQPGSSKTPVNLRWLLANDVRRRLMADGVSEEQLVFLSIHADSLHEKARGAMAYYPQAALRPPSQEVSWPSYRRFREARPENAFAMTRQEALRAEGLSRRLAEAIVSGVGDAGLVVHRFEPVRGHVVRGRAWVPAVLRYNRVPASVLLEAVNLNNGEDQINLRDPAYRQRLAEAVVTGLERHFNGAGGEGGRER